MDYKIIDSHCHIFSDSIAPKAIKNVYQFYGRDEEIPEGMGTVKYLLELNKKLGIEKNIITQVAMSPEITKLVNKYILKEYELHPNVFIPLVSVHPKNEDIFSMLSEYKKQGAKGVKLHPDSQRFKMDCEEADTIYKACGELFLPILMHCGDEHLDNTDAFRLVNVLKKHRDTKIIAAHFGGYSKWENTYATLQQVVDYQNLYFDVSSSMPYMNNKDLVYEFINCFGYKKFLYGSDYPISDAVLAIQDVKNLSLSQEQEKAILRDNACELYQL